MKKLFIGDTTNGFIQFFRFCFVGFAATVADMAAGISVRYFLNPRFALDFSFFSLGRDSVSGAIGFIIGLAVNYLISVLWVFKRNDISRVKEFSVFAVISIIGLFINTAIIEVLGIFILKQSGFVFIIKKIIATVFTMFWNFFARKLILYRNN
ncbi:MAG: GtrA family protein [Clostridia bacterium]|nr:GtrA family protein [Clostridia bacterium]